MAKNQFPGIYDRNIYDEARSFCRVERIDEDNFRYCIAKRLRQASPATGILTKIAAYFRHAGKTEFVKIHHLMPRHNSLKTHPR